MTEIKQPCEYIIPAPEGLTCNAGGTEFPIIGFIGNDKQKIPLIDFPQMSDYKWQMSCLHDRLEHPENYRAIGEDVDATVKHLEQWLDDYERSLKAGLSPHLLSNLDKKGEKND